MPKLRVAIGCRFQFSDYMNNSLVVLSGCRDYFFFLSRMLRPTCEEFSGKKVFACFALRLEVADGEMYLSGLVFLTYLLFFGSALFACIFLVID